MRSRRCAATRVTSRAASSPGCAACRMRCCSIRRTGPRSPSWSTRSSPRTAGARRSPRCYEPAVPTALPIVAIVGRPNVGKSTLFNRYAGRRRALVEDRPGITRDRIAEEVDVEGRRVLVVDTAGLDAEAEAGLAAAVQAQAWSAIRDADAIRSGG